MESGRFSAPSEPLALPSGQSQSVERSDRLSFHVGCALRFRLRAIASGLHSLRSSLVWWGRLESSIRRSENDNEVSVSWLIKSIAYGIVDGLRRNKLATALASVTLVVLLVLAVDSRFDGLDHYQEFILPRLLRLETGFLNSLRSAEGASGEWRAYYFENAHRNLKDILRAARLDRPQGHVARTKHRELIRYYELLDSEFNRIGMQMRLNPDLDYLRQFTDKMDELKPIRDAWAQWANPRKVSQLLRPPTAGK